MSGKKKALLAASLLIVTIAFAGIGFAVTKNTANTAQTNMTADSGDEENKRTTGKIGNKEEAEKLLEQTVTRDEIKEKVGEWNNFELDGAGCERGVYAGKFFYDNILINSRTYDKGETFRIIIVQDQ